ncbi:MAG: acetate--CoA ligase family protein [Patescibacteria group bacterium]
MSSMSLPAVFTPKSIAVIGASTRPGSVGNDIVKNLAEHFVGDIYPINPKGGELYGLPVFASIADVPGSVELAVVAVPARLVPTVLKQAGEKKIKAAVIISAGFGEVGNYEDEEKLVELAEQYGFTLIGPNCLGVMNPHLKMNASFAPTMPEAGSIAFLSQSGALGTAILDYACSHNLGFSKFLSLGNKAAVDEAVLLRYLADDPETKVILLYVEGLRDIESLHKVAQEIRQVRHPKPIIVLKSGQTERGAAAASSHTGALAGNDELYDALFRQAGIIRAQKIEDLFLYAECFLSNPVFKKDRVAVITNAGGPGVLLTDALVREQLTMAHFSESTKQELQSFLPEAASVENPVDILGDADAGRYSQTLEIVAADRGVDAMIILLTPQSMTEVEETALAIIELKRRSKKPIVVSLLGGERVEAGLGLLQDAQLATADFPEDAAQGLGAMHQYSQWQGSSKKPTLFRNFSHQTLQKLVKNRRQSGWLREDQALQVLTACGIRVAPWQVVRSASGTQSAVQAIGEPAVLKCMSPDILHKSDAGGVVLNVTAETARASYDQLMAALEKSHPKATITGVLVMQQVQESFQEMIIGGVRDPNLGALVGVGMGGVFTEIFKDAAFGLVPVNEHVIEEMLGRLKMTALLKGARGTKHFDVPALKETVARISQAMRQYPEITELDINPILLFQKSGGVMAVDARVKVR